MTQAFDCPKCGAPLSFEPHPGDETVVCPYCNETAIIPEEMRIPLPRVVVLPQAPPAKSNRLIWVIVAVGAVIFIAVCVSISLAIPSTRSTYGLQSNSRSIVSGSATPTILSVANSGTATVEANATVDILQPMLKLEQSWPASFTEPFTDNSHHWLTGDLRDSYISGNRSISNGTYTWKITAVKSTSDFAFPTMPDQSDFYASLDMKLVSMPADDPDADAGIVFRHNSINKTWYYFAVNDKDQYYFGWYDGTDWYSLIPETDSTAIHPGQTNRLEVGVQGSQFIFFINDQMVDHFIDDNLKTGDIGLGINLPQSGEKATVEFANFTVLSSSLNP